MFQKHNNSLGKVKVSAVTGPKRVKTKNDDLSESKNMLEPVTKHGFLGFWNFSF